MTGHSDQPLLRPGRLLAYAALLPVAASAASIVIHIDPGSWFSLSAPLRQALWRDALLYTAGAVIIAAPLAGVSLTHAHRARRGRGTFVSLTALLASAAAVCAVTSAALALLVFDTGNLTSVSFMATSHVTVFAVGFALAAFGAFCGTLFADALDGAACGLLVVLIAAGGLLVGGASVANLPAPLLDAAITASPFMAMTSSAHVDVVRMAVPYQMSPLARLQVEYPAWYAASASYLLFACLCLVGAHWKGRSWRAATAS